MKLHSTVAYAAVVASALQMLIAGTAFAQATRTWVSGVGDDANPCSRTAPCKTYAGAISKTQAGGEISTLDPAGYGGVTITKSITINGDGTLASVLVSGTPGITISAGASDVIILRNLSVIGLGSGTEGVRFLAGGSLHVENLKISGFANNGILFQPSAASELMVNNTTIIDNNGAGILVQPGGSGYANVAIDHVTLENNGQGLLAQDGATVVVANSMAATNTGSGIVATGVSRSVDMTITNTVCSNNGFAGIQAGNWGTIKISNITASRNYIGVLISGGNIVSFRNNTVYGNTGADGLPNYSFPLI
jgi:Right handed beta helix region